MGEDGPGRAHSFPGGVCHGKLNRINKATALVCFFCSSFSVHKQGHWWLLPDWAKMFQPPWLHQNQRCYPLWGLLTVQFVFLKLFPSYLFCLISPLWALPFWVPICQVLSHLHTEKNRTALPAFHLTIIAARGLMLTPNRSKLGVITAPHRIAETHQD